MLVVQAKESTISVIKYDIALLVLAATIHSEYKLLID